jgi:inward rectifier potassium channel
MLHYHETTSFSFRIANGSPNELIEVEVRILLCMTQSTHGVRTRYFHELGLERQKISFFPMDWTVAHPITEDSPLYQVTSDELEKRDAEFLVLINAVDDNSCQVVHARASYKWNEVVWGARFKDMYRHTRKGRMTDKARSQTDSRYPGNRLTGCTESDSVGYITTKKAEVTGTSADCLLLVPVRCSG